MLKRLTTFFIINLCLTISAFSVTISGKMLNASHDSSGVANHVVSLQRMSKMDQMPAQLGEATTLTNGAFSFQLDAIDTLASYFAVTDFQGVRYYSDAVTFSGKSGLVNVVVSDSTHSLENVEILMHHLIIEDLGNTISLRETRVLHNSGSNTVVEAQQTPDGPILTQSALPAGATAFTALSEQLQNELFVQDGILYDTGILPPGNRQISYTYEVPWKKNAIMLQMPISFATRSYDVFIAGDNIQVIAQNLEEKGPFSIRGQNYKRFGTTDIPANTIIRFALERTGKAPVATNGQSPFFAILLTSILLGLVFLAHFFKKGESKKK